MSPCIRRDLTLRYISSHRSFCLMLDLVSGSSAFSGSSIDDLEASAYAWTRVLLPDLKTPTVHSGLYGLGETIYSITTGYISSEEGPGKKLKGFIGAANFQDLLRYPGKRSSSTANTKKLVSPRFLHLYSSKCRSKCVFRSSCDPPKTS